MSLDGLQIRGAYPGTIVYPPGGTFGPRVQQDIQFVLLHTGSMRVEVDDETITAQPGQVVMLLPGPRETFAFARDRSTWHRWISVTVLKLEDRARAELEALPRVIQLTEEFNRLTDIMLSLHDKRQLGSELGAALGYAAIQLYTAAASIIPGTEAIHPSVLAVKETVHRRYGEELTLGQLAKEGGVTPEHLVRLFKKYESTTPMQYVWRYRVLAACDLLAHTGLSVGDIALRCGFKTSYHFSRVIKSHTGKTPSDIRRESWSGRTPGSTSWSE